MPSSPYTVVPATDGDTFGNVVFHDEATAAHAVFTNIGGTVPGGDGGNTQFYNDSTAGYATFNNRGGTNYGLQNDKEAGANGGDVAFDGTSSSGNGVSITTLPRFQEHTAEKLNPYPPAQVISARS